MTGGSRRAEPPDLQIHPGIRPISDKAFALFQALIYREAGIYLSSAKKPLLAGRLNRRLRDLKLRSFDEYYLLVSERDEAERLRMFDLISTHETHFFREPRQFEFLARELFPRWSSEAAAGTVPKRIRAWSAGCSTGEEPYSLAMALLEHFPPSAGWELEILASDLSGHTLETAREGIWPIEKSTEIPAAYLKSYMLRGTARQEGKMKAGPEIRSLVRFERINLNEESYPVTGRFDLLFCRNVLIYFDKESKGRVIHRLIDRLSPSGHLFLGHAESLTGLTDRVRTVIPTVYADPAQEGGSGR